MITSLTFVNSNLALGNDLRSTSSFGSRRAISLGIGVYRFTSRYCRLASADSGVSTHLLAVEK